MLVKLITYYCSFLLNFLHDLPFHFSLQEKKKRKDKQENENAQEIQLKTDWDLGAVITIEIVRNWIQFNIINVTVEN